MSSDVVEAITFEGKYIRIRESGSSESGKTKCFRIDSKEGDYELAYIRFYPKWRKYVFEPLDNTVYEEVCLREIANFIEVETKKWRGLKRLADDRESGEEQ